MKRELNLLPRVPCAAFSVRCIRRTARLTHSNITITCDMIRLYGSCHTKAYTSSHRQTVALLLTTLSQITAYFMFSQECRLLTQREVVVVRNRNRTVIMPSKSTTDWQETSTVHIADRWRHTQNRWRHNKQPSQARCRTDSSGRQRTRGKRGPLPRIRSVTTCTYIKGVQTASTAWICSHCFLVVERQQARLFYVQRTKYQTKVHNTYFVSYYTKTTHSTQYNKFSSDLTHSNDTAVRGTAGWASGPARRRHRRFLPVERKPAASCLTGPSAAGVLTRDTAASEPAPAASAATAGSARTRHSDDPSILYGCRQTHETCRQETEGAYTRYDFNDVIKAYKLCISNKVTKFQNQRAEG